MNAPEAKACRFIRIKKGRKNHILLKHDVKKKNLLWFFFHKHLSATKLIENERIATSERKTREGLPHCCVA